MIRILRWGDVRSPTIPVSDVERALAFYRDNATALHERCTRHGARIVKGLRDHEYGMRAFVVADPDGNCIDIGERL